MDTVVLERVAHFCESNRFSDQVEALRNLYLYLFEETKVDEGEQPLERMDAFLQHQKLVDALITEFANEENINPSDLLEGLRDALDGNFTPLFEEHEYLWLAQLLLSWTDYDAFCESMKVAATSKLRK